MTFIVRIHATGSQWPDGSITISDGAFICCSSLITKDPNSNDGLATITQMFNAPASYTMVAVYGGNNPPPGGVAMYDAGAQSNTVLLTVNKAPQLSVGISANPGPRDGTLVSVALTVTNSSTVPASGITLNQLVLRTLAGTGDAALSSPTLPAMIGNLQPGASTVVNLQLQLPTKAEKLGVYENDSLPDAAGNVYQFSFGQVLFP